MTDLPEIVSKKQGMEERIAQLSYEKEELEKKSEKLQDKKDKLRKELYDQLEKADRFSVDQHNAVFRQMAGQLILVAGILLAFSTQFNQSTSKSLAIKILTLLIIICLNLSILFGILQHLMEASFFKRIALGRREIRKKLNFNKTESLSEFFGALNQFEVMVGNSTKRWPTYVQMSLLALVVIMISIASSLKLFG